MKCCIFSGPTLRPGDRALLPDVLWLAPVKQGDIYRAVTLGQQQVVGIIDGYFQWVPAVWHKEILWALHRGVHVFGAASMGALRASELAAYGMQGIGKIFEAYCSGVLAPFEEPFEDDDEVAVVHGPAEYGYLPVSEAMVNVRMTLLAAERANVIEPKSLQTVLSIAKSIFFAERTYERILGAAESAGIAREQLEALKAWLPGGRIDQKRCDGLALLERIRSFLADEHEAVKLEFQFEHTLLWQRAVEEWEDASPHPPEDREVLDELRVQGERFSARWQQAFDALVEPRGQAGREEREATTDDWAVLARARAAERAGLALPRTIVERHLLERLRGSGEYLELQQRANDKRMRLPRAVDASELSEIDRLRLENWYFNTCLCAEIPDDLEGYLSRSGYPDLPSFYTAIWRELLYRESLGEESPNASAGAVKG